MTSAQSQLGPAGMSRPLADVVSSLGIPSLTPAGGSLAGRSVAAQSSADVISMAVAVPSDVIINDLTLDSRAVVPGGLFLAVKGRTHHGLKFAGQAVARGA